MHRRTCVVCGVQFEALSADYCSSTCRSRASRAETTSKRRRPVPPLTTFAPRAVSDPYVKLNTEFATALGVSLPGDLLAVLALAADGDDYRGDCTEGEFATVALHVTDRLQATIRRADWDGSERLARSLLALVDDLVDTRVLSYLAAAL